MAFFRRSLTGSPSTSPGMHTSYVFSVPHSSFSLNARMIRSERSRRMTLSRTASLSLPVSATICLSVAAPMPSMTLSMSSSPGMVSSVLMAAYLSASSCMTNLTFPLTYLPRRISPFFLISFHSLMSKFSTLL